MIREDTLRGILNTKLERLIQAIQCLDHMKRDIRSIKQDIEQLRQRLSSPEGRDMGLAPAELPPSPEPTAEEQADTGSQPSWGNPGGQSAP